MRALQCDPQGLRLVEIRFGDFVGQIAMLVWIAAQGPHPELAVGLEGTYDCAALLS